MQKQSVETLFSRRVLLTPKSCPVHGRLLPSVTVDVARASYRSKRQIRWESTTGTATDAEKEKQRKAPWHREGSDIPPVARQRSAGAMVKGTWISMPASSFD